MAKEQIEIFTGNRADFGILLSYIIEFSKHYRINLLISGAHLLKNWSTLDEIETKVAGLKSHKNINLIPMDIPEIDRDDNYSYAEYLPVISKRYIDHCRKLDRQNIKFTLVLGDRIETLAVVMSALYLNRVIIHISGGDVSNTLAYDTNVRHSITKVAHIHLVTNKKSYQVIKQLGESEWRIHNVGMPSLDLDRLGMVASKSELARDLRIREDEVILFTYHPDQYAGAKSNLANFKKALNSVILPGKKLVITYPNNDPGYSEMIGYLKSISASPNVEIVRNLGSDRYLGMMKNFKTILVGNSSSMVTESAYFNTPAVLLGSRQKDRPRGKNVFEFRNMHPEVIKNKIKNIFANYSKYRENFKDTRFLYGRGDSAVKGLKSIEHVFESKERETIQTKHFEEYVNLNSKWGKKDD